MPTRNVVLTEHQHKFVDLLVETGRYQNASEVLREGLRLIEQRERLELTQLAALREAAGKGWADIDAGRYLDMTDDQLEGAIGQLGRTAAERVAARNR